MCLTMFLIALYGDTTCLRYGGRDVLRVRLLCEMRKLHLLYFLSSFYVFDGVCGSAVG
jgi:hypothetical protein